MKSENTQSVINYYTFKTTHFRLTSHSNSFPPLEYPQSCCTFTILWILIDRLVCDLSACSHLPCLRLQLSTINAVLKRGSLKSRLLKILNCHCIQYRRNTVIPTSVVIHSCSIFITNRVIRPTVIGDGHQRSLDLYLLAGNPSFGRVSGRRNPFTVSESI